MTHDMIDDDSTDTLIARFYRHCEAVERNTRDMVWHILCARGLHKLLAERAITADDEQAGNVALGAPHWLTYNDGTLTDMLHTRKDA